MHLANLATALLTLRCFAMTRKNKLVLLFMALFGLTTVLSSAVS